MVSVYIDPFVLACPPVETELVEFEEYINNLLDWKELKELKWVSLYLSEKTYEVLEQTHCYPPWDNLKQIITKLGMRGVQPKDIIVLVDALIKKLPCIEKKLKLKEILFDNAQCIPDNHIVNRGLTYIEQYQRMMFFMYLTCFFEHAENKDQILITRLLERDHVSVAISGDIIECEFNDSLKNIELPSKVNSDFFSCKNRNGLYLSIDPYALWRKADCEEAYRKAVYIYIYQKLKSVGLLLIEENLPVWSFGNELFRTAKELGFLREEEKIKLLFKSFADTILKENLGKTHWLRTGSGGNNPQRVKDGGVAKAWRRDIDYEYHLHYWEIEGKSVEFAAVVVHNDMSIPS